MQFRKKPVVIEAVQFTGENVDEVAEFLSCQQPFIKDGCLMIGTLEGEMRATPGDWIIRGIKGEFYPCKPDIFAATYSPNGAPGSITLTADEARRLRRFIKAYRTMTDDMPDGCKCELCESLAAIADIKLGEE